MDFEKPNSTQAALIALGLDPNVNHTLESIKKAYKKKALECHPDHNPNDPQAQKKFMSVSYAYEMLTNPEFRSKGHVQENLDIISNISLSFDECFFGKTLNIFRFMTNQTNKESYEKSRDYEVSVTPVAVVIPPGTFDTEVLVRGEGVKKGDLAGNLLVRIRTMPHNLFTMEGRNVVCSFRIPLHKMIKGGVEEVPTMYGIKKMRIPQGTCPGDRLSIKGCGVAKRGVQTVVVEPLFPGKEELRINDIWKGMNINWEEIPEPVDDVEQFRESFGRMSK